MLSSPWFLLFLFAMIGVLLVQGWRRTRHLRVQSDKRSHDGTTLIAAVGGPEAQSPECTETLAAFALSETKVAYACGHDYADKFGHDFYGEKREVTEKVLDERKKCGDCMLDEVRPLLIRCASCGFSVWPGEPVAVYGNNGSFKKEWSTFTPDGRGVIGCMRWGCCPSGGFFAGHWSSRGFLPAFADGSLAAHVMATGEAVVVNIKDDGSVDVTKLDDKKK